MRLFNRLGFGPYEKYHELQQDFREIVQTVSNEECRQWHAVIDVHGKVFGKNQQLDERWLINR